MEAAVSQISRRCQACRSVAEVFMQATAVCYVYPWSVVNCHAHAPM